MGKRDKEIQIEVRKGSKWRGATNSDVTGPSPISSGESVDTPAIDLHPPATSEKQRRRGWSGIFKDTTFQIWDALWKGGIGGIASVIALKLADWLGFSL